MITQVPWNDMNMKTVLLLLNDCSPNWEFLKSVTEKLDMDVEGL